MSKIEWRVDGDTHIVLRKPFLMKRKIELNGQRVHGEWHSKRFDFKLADGRAADIELKSDMLSRYAELRVAGRLIPDARYVPDDLRCPNCSAGIQLVDEFCSKCGHNLGAPERFMYQRSVTSATNAIRLLAALFAIFGFLMFSLMRDSTQTALHNLAQFQDDEVLEPINGVTYTAGELRKRVVWEQRGMLIANLILSVVMVVLAWWSKFKPLPAILIATAVYVAVQIIAAIMDPSTLAQGIIMKAVIIGILVKGIKGALSARTENG